MARNISTINEIKQYVAKVTVAASHHAPNVQHVIPLLENEVLERLKLPTDKFQVYERNGNLARTCWITFATNRYAFSYNYQTQMIELKQGSLQGQLIQDFSNSTAQAKIQSVIKSL